MAEKEMANPTIRIETREQLLYTLTEAAEIEHNLMCCYLYAAFSMKTGEDEGLNAEQSEAVKRWRQSIVHVAVDEMTHLALVSNLMVAIGGAPHFGRPNFPITPGYHPAGVQVDLAPFNADTLQHFVYLERPEGSDEVDGDGFASALAYHCELGSAQRLMPSGQDYETVGELYHAVAQGLAHLCERDGEDCIFVGGTERQALHPCAPLSHRRAAYFFGEC
ncbi:ferritin-like domain-containing protein [Sphingorhabdus arenilitoris]|uniref:Ferritin-like domain-containing protein n=1 Tax=Sphingorhabdus arenilitoris TaxID=1490041 RepID=A0ABV8RJW6_9SPHN